MSRKTAKHFFAAALGAGCPICGAVVEWGGIGTTCLGFIGPEDRNPNRLWRPGYCSLCGLDFTHYVKPSLQESWSVADGRVVGGHTSSTAWPKPCSECETGWMRAQTDAPVRTLAGLGRRSRPRESPHDHRAPRRCRLEQRAHGRSIAMIAPSLDELPWAPEPAGLGVHLVKNAQGVVNICTISDGKDGLCMGSSRGPRPIGPYQEKHWEWAPVGLILESPAALDILQALQEGEEHIEEARGIAAGYLERILTLKGLKKKQRAFLAGCKPKHLAALIKAWEATGADE